MAVMVNFFASWMLLTLCVNRGDMLGMILVMMGFLLMHCLCEQHDSESHTHH